MLKQKEAQEEFIKTLLTLDRVSAESILRGAVKINDMYESIEQLSVPVLGSVGNKWD